MLRGMKCTAYRPTRSGSLSQKWTNMTTPGNQTELAHTTANLGFSSFNGIPYKLIAEHGMEFGMKCGASPLRGLAASAVSFLIPSRLHIGLAVFICSLHGVDRTCICCSLWVLSIVLRLFSETVCCIPCSLVYLRLSQVDSSLQVSSMWTISILNILCIWGSFSRLWRMNGNLGPSNMDPEGRASTTPYLACCIQLSSLMLWGTRVIAFLRSAFFLRGGRLQNPVQNLKVFAQQLPSPLLQCGMLCGLMFPVFSDVLLFCNFPCYLQHFGARAAMSAVFAAL